MQSAILLLVAGVLPLLAGAPRRAYLTDFGRLILGRSDLVVEGRVVRIQKSFRGVRIAFVKVDRRILGLDRSEEIRLMYIDDFTAPEAFTSTLDKYTLTNVTQPKERGILAKVTDPLELRKPKERPTGGTDERKSRATAKAAAGQPKGTGIRLRTEEEGLFFLERTGSSYGIVGIVPAEDPRFDRKRQRLLDVVAIESESTIDTRFERARSFYMSGLTQKDRWVRGNSAREISSLAVRFPKMFTKGDAKRLATLRLKERDPTIRAALGRGLRSLDPDLGLAIEQEAEANETARFGELVAREERVLKAMDDPHVRAAELLRVGAAYRRGGTRLYVKYLDAESPLLRAQAARVIGEYGGPSARPAVREQLKKERVDQVSRYLIHACGILNDPKSVPALATKLNNPELFNLAAATMARIGTIEARDLLRKVRLGADKEQGRFLDALLREEFSRGS